MYVINKLRADSAIDYAAEEMRKYLWMMMPELGDVKINYDPQATDGFRLGLLEDFGLPCDVEDPILDDIIHVDVRGKRLKAKPVAKHMDQSQPPYGRAVITK